MPRTRRLVVKSIVLAVGLTVLASALAEGALLAPGIGDVRAEIATELKPDRVPVVLVHGLRGNASSTWGAPADEDESPRGIYIALCRAGYKPGQTLFVCDYRDDNIGDYREIALRDLPAAIEKALAASGADRVDRDGSGIGLGHPVGSTGSRIMVTLIHAMRRHGKTLGLATLCGGGGISMACAIEML